MNTKTSVIFSLTAAGLIPSVVTSYADNNKNINEKKKLNIVYIMTDDHSFQTMSCYDNRYINTPNLDRIADEGVRFDKAFVCNSISGPSRAVLMTGKHSHNNGKLDNYTVFDGEQQTFPKLLQQAGYQTAIVGKWHLDSNPTGFDFWEILPGQGSYYNPDFITPQGNKKYEGYVTNIITDMATDWLDNRDENKPFCLLVHHKAVHRVWMSDTCDVAQFEDKTFPVPENFFDDYKGRKAASLQKMSIDKDMDLIYDLKMIHPEVTSPMNWTGEVNRMTPQQRAAWDKVYVPIVEDFVKNRPEGKELAIWKYQRYMRDYLKSVKSVDDNIGRLMKYLEDNDLLENTLIIYTSDQGFYMGEHGWFDKRFMYEESMRTPLVMRLPEQAQFASHGKIDKMVQNIDFAPTILDIAGVDIPDDMDGVSLVPLLENKKVKNWRNSLYYHYYEHPGEHAVRKHYGVRTERYKLIRFYGHDVEEWELYDLKKDPMEMNNIYSNPKMKEVINDLKIELEKLRTQYKDS